MAFLMLPLTARAADTLPRSVMPLMEKLAEGQPLQRGRVSVDMPLIAENGHSVPLTVNVESPMTRSDHVQKLYVVSEKNPRPVIAAFSIGPRAGRARVVTRVRLAGSQHVIALARMSDGSAWYGTAEVNVTESACLDGPA